MKLIAPDYYTDFKCIADKCIHNCCIGWEIDIDEYTRSYYEEIISAKPEEIPSSFIKRLSEGIAYTDDTAYFRLGENERCPFLNKDNLCDIILTLGEDSLCSICNDHPRFRNYFTDRTEAGIGLCCEEAARLILRKSDQAKLCVLGDDGGTEQLSAAEQAAIDKRTEIFRILQDRTVTIEGRLKAISDQFVDISTEKSHSEWTDIFLSLERLDEKWGELLKRHRDFKSQIFDYSILDKYDICFEQLSVYLTFRHFSNGALENTVDKTAAFIVLSCNMIRNLFAAESQTKNAEDLFDVLTEIVRMFSAEVEYSDCNIEKLMAML